MPNQQSNDKGGNNNEQMSPDASKVLEEINSIRELIPQLVQMVNQILAVHTTAIEDINKTKTQSKIEISQEAKKALDALHQFFPAHNSHTADNPQFQHPYMLNLE